MNIFFDKNFYLIANPDVFELNVDAKKHYNNHGKKEGRISSKKNCKKIIYNLYHSNTIKIQNLFAKKYDLNINNNASIIKYSLPWRINNEGFPNTIYEFQLKNIINNYKNEFDKSIIYFEKKRKPMCYISSYET